jgi:hypothetical protein
VSDRDAGIGPYKCISLAFEVTFGGSIPKKDSAECMDPTLQQGSMANGTSVKCVITRVTGFRNGEYSQRYR